MASNLYTKQPPKAGSSIKMVLAERAYVHAANTVYADPTDRLEGALPSGWTDLGIVMGSQVQLTYTKEVKYVETGIEKIRRGSYVLQKTASAAFTLEQADVDILATIGGMTVDTLGTDIGKKVHIGQDDIVEKALLFVGSNKVDDKEVHTYCKRANITWSIEQEDDARVIRVQAELFAFVPAGETDEAYYTMYVLNPDISA